MVQLDVRGQIGGRTSARLEWDDLTVPALENRLRADVGAGTSPDLERLFAMSFDDITASDLAQGIALCRYLASTDPRRLGRVVDELTRLMKLRMPASREEWRDQQIQSVETVTGMSREKLESELTEWIREKAFQVFRTK